MNSEIGCDVSPPAERAGAAVRILLLAVSAYRLLLAPLMGGFCRFIWSGIRSGALMHCKTNKDWPTPIAKNVDWMLGAKNPPP